MTIGTRYNIGDEVWFMLDNKVCNSKICKIKVAIDAYYFNSMAQEIIKYEGYVLDIHSNRGLDKPEKIYKANVLFPTKEELLKSL